MIPCQLACIYDLDRGATSTDLGRESVSALGTHSQVDKRCRGQQHKSFLTRVLPYGALPVHPCRCAYSDLPLVFASGSVFSASVERLCNALGHVQGNCIWVLLVFNAPYAQMSADLFAKVRLSVVVFCGDFFFVMASYSIVVL